MSLENVYFLQISPTQRLLANEYTKCKIIMAQVLLLAASLNTLDLNYFRTKITDETLFRILYGEGLESKAKLNAYFEELNIEDLTFDEKLALKCFERKLRYLEEKDLSEVSLEIDSFLEENKENLSEEILSFYGFA